MIENHTYPSIKYNNRLNIKLPLSTRLSEALCQNLLSISLTNTFIKEVKFQNKT